MGDSVLGTRTQTADGAWPKHFQLESQQRQQLIRLRHVLVAMRVVVAACLIGWLVQWMWSQPSMSQTWRTALPMWLGVTVFWFALFSWLEPRLTMRQHRMITDCSLTEPGIAIDTAWRTASFEWSHVLDIEQVPPDHHGQCAGLAVLRLMPTPAREEFFLIDVHMREQERLLQAIEQCSGVTRSPTDRIAFRALRTQSA